MLDVFLIIQAYFLVGVFLFIKARKRQAPDKRSAWSKYFTYMMIVNFITYSITKNMVLFHVLALFIVLQGLYEIVRAMEGKGKSIKFKTMVFTIYALLGLGFLSFTTLSSGLMVWSYLAIFIFDGFSQICGQLFGKRKLAPTISPNKTIEGTIGGTIITLVSVYFMGHISGLTSLQSVLLGALICVTALVGDLLASYVKRKCGIKDYGQLLPGHGGILDRFDSFVFSGAAVYLTVWVI